MINNITELNKPYEFPDFKDSQLFSGWSSYTKTVTGYFTDGTIKEIYGYQYQDAWEQGSMNWYTVEGNFVIDEDELIGWKDK